MQLPQPRTLTGPAAAAAQTTTVPNPPANGSGTIRGVRAPRRTTTFGVRLAAAVDANGAAARSGVVRSLDVANQTVRVSWLKAAEPGEVECDETVSAYELEKDLDHDIFYGDIVIRRRQPLESASHGGSGSGGRTEAPAPATQGNEEVAGAVANDLSWVGQVNWGTGNSSKVLPHEVEVVPKRSLDEMIQEMIRHFLNKQDGVDKAQDCELFVHYSLRS
ncbi:unnamed protein product [Urochloa humidicola]